MNKATRLILSLIAKALSIMFWLLAATNAYRTVRSIIELQYPAPEVTGGVIVTILFACAASGFWKLGRYAKTSSFKKQATKSEA
ncbi:hypothetical protein QF019_002483 [Pseudomonas frederiksbergensis]|uniref:hypothetical protein n=1 Tax=Pseudomonas frederiksbergensis TaxID=104087 RepID=UPI003D21A9FD